MPAAATVCVEFFDSATVLSKCAGRPALRWWYREVCVITSSKTRRISDTTIAMTDFASLCATSDESSKALLKLICHLNITLPDWLTEKCSGCDFGYKTSSGSCMCYYGYYGDNCDSVCPGGTVNPCNGHGVCDVSGECPCSGHWNGTACDECATDWSGIDCTVMIPPDHASLAHTSASMLVAQVNLIGQLYTFDGVVFDMHTNGYFRLLSLSTKGTSFSGHFSACDSGTSLYICLVGIVFEQGGTSYYVSHKDFSGKSVQLITTNSSHILYGELVLGPIHLTLESQTTMVLTIAGSGVEVKVSSISQSLLVTFSVPRTEWNAQDNNTHDLLTACNTPLAIEMSNCTNMTKCSTDQSSTPDTCRLNQTLIAMSLYVSTNAYKDETFIDMIEAKTVSPLGSNCLYFTGIGMILKTTRLPLADFTMELHVKPVYARGTIVTYVVNQSHLALQIKESGLVLVHGTTISLTGIQLEMKQWNQINLVWRLEAQILEVYITYRTGTIQVTSVDLPSEAFATGGSLTVGQSLSGPSHSNGSAEFVGYIDEVRIWSRPHNPSIIRSNFRVKVTAETSGILYSWNFNEGIGLVAYERRKKDNLIPIQVINHPTWAKSNLDLTENSNLDSPRVTASAAVAAHDITSARGTCSSLISGFSLSTTGSSMATIISVYEALCIKQVTSAKDKKQAAAVMASMAELYTSIENKTKNPLDDMCASDVLESISEYLGAGGKNCTRCVFGDIINGSCVCTGSHSGPACDRVCPVARFGSCNDYAGVCGPNKGKCHCHPHYYGQHHTAELYWISYIASNELPVKATYACDSCIDHWTGSTCDIAQAIRQTTEYYVAIVYGSYVTTLDGRSYSFVIPGVYSLMATPVWNAQALFMPCPGINQCRFMTEIAIRTTKVTVDITQDNSMKLQFTFDGVLQEFPKTLTVGNISVSWTIEQYVRISQGLSSVLVYSSPVGLVAFAKIHSTEAAYSTGLVGNANGTWLSESLCKNAQSLPADPNDDSHMWKCLKKYFTPAEPDRFINSTYKTESLGSGGYCVALLDQTLTFTHLAKKLPHILQEFTFTYWVRIIDTTVSMKGSFPLVKLNLGTIMELHVDNGHLQVKLDQIYITTIHVTLDIWSYIAMTWPDGNSINIYYLTETDVQTDTVTLASHAGKTKLDAITVSTAGSVMLEVDCIRAWGQMKTLSEAANDMSDYCGPSPQDQSLLVAVPIDEGGGLDVVMTTYTSDDRTSIPQATITGAISDHISNTTWRPSSIPVINVYTPSTLTAETPRGTSRSYLGAAKACLALLNSSSSDVNKHCHNITSSVRDHFLEACIRDYDRAGSDNATDILQNTLLFYCHVTLDIDECSLAGHMDFCIRTPHETPLFPVWLIVVISCTVILTLIVLFAIGCYCKRKQKRESKTGDGRGAAWPGYEEETSFSWRENTAVTEGHRVVIPRPQIEAEGLDIYNTTSDKIELEPDYDIKPASDPVKGHSAWAHDNPSYTDEDGATWRQHEVITARYDTDVTSFKPDKPTAEGSWIDKARNIKIKRPVVAAGRAASDDDDAGKCDTTYL